MKILKSILLIIIDFLAVFTGFAIASLICGITGSGVASLEISQRLVLSLVACVTGCAFVDFSTDPDRSSVTDIVGITVAFAAMSLLANFLFSSLILSSLIYYLIVYAWMLLIGIFSKLVIRGNSSYDDDDYDDEEDDEEEERSDFSGPEAPPENEKKKPTPLKSFFTRNKESDEKTDYTEADDPFEETTLPENNAVNDSKISVEPKEETAVLIPNENVKNAEDTLNKKTANEEDLSFINEDILDDAIPNNTDAAAFFARGDSIGIESGFIPIEDADILELKPLNDKIIFSKGSAAAPNDAFAYQEKNEATPVQTQHPPENELLVEKNKEDLKEDEAEKTKPLPESLLKTEAKQIFEVQEPAVIKETINPPLLEKNHSIEDNKEEQKSDEAEDVPLQDFDEPFASVPLPQNENSAIEQQPLPVPPKTANTAPPIVNEPIEKEKTVCEEDNISSETNQREEMTQQDQLLLERLLKQLDERDRQIQELEKTIHQRENPPREEVSQRTVSSAEAYTNVSSRESYIERNKREILDSILDDVKNMYSNLSSRERIVEDREYSLLLKMAEMGSKERLNSTRENSSRKSELRFTPSDDPTLASDIRDIIEAYKHSAEQSPEMARETTRIKEKPQTIDYRSMNNPPYENESPHQYYREPAPTFYGAQTKPEFYEQPNDQYIPKAAPPHYRTEQDGYYAAEVRQQPYYGQRPPYAAQSEQSPPYRENASYYPEVAPNYYHEPAHYYNQSNANAEAQIRPEYNRYEQNSTISASIARPTTVVENRPVPVVEQLYREQERTPHSEQPLFNEHSFSDLRPQDNNGFAYAKPSETKEPVFTMAPLPSRENANDTALPEKKAEDIIPEHNTMSGAATPEFTLPEAQETISAKPTVEKADIIETTITLNGLADTTVSNETCEEEKTATVIATEEKIPASTAEQAVPTITQNTTSPTTAEEAVTVNEEDKIPNPVLLTKEEPAAEQIAAKTILKEDDEKQYTTLASQEETAAEQDPQTAKESFSDIATADEQNIDNTPQEVILAADEDTLANNMEAEEGPDFEELEIKDFIIAPYRSGESDPTKAQRKRNALNLPTMSEPRIRPAESKMRIQFKPVATSSPKRQTADSTAEKTRPTSFAEAKAQVIAREKAKAEVEAKARAEAERLRMIEEENARKRAEAEARARELAKEEARIKAEEEKRLRLLAQQKAREEEIKRIKADEERKAAELRQKQEEQRVKAAEEERQRQLAIAKEKAHKEEQQRILAEEQRQRTIALTKAIEEERQKQIAMQLAKEKLEAEARKKAEAEAMAKAIKEENKRQAEIKLKKATLEAEERQRAEAEKARAEAKAIEEEKRRRQAAEEALMREKAEAEAKRLREEEIKANTIALERQRAIENEKKRLDDEAKERKVAAQTDHGELSFPIDIKEDDFFDSDLSLHNQDKTLNELDKTQPKPQQKPVEKIDFETVPSINRNEVNFKDAESSKIGLMANELAGISDLLDDM